MHSSKARRQGLVISLVLFGTAAAVMCSPFVSCSPRVYPTATRDSVYVETIRERVVHDTAWFDVPRQTEARTVRDTVSHLENDWAESTAAIDTAGFLSHTLSTKARRVAVPVAVTVHDTTIIERTGETVVVETNKLTRAQQGWVNTGKIAVGVFVVLFLLFVAWLVIKIKKLI